MKTFGASPNLPRLVIAIILGPLALGCAAVSMAADKGDLPHAVVKFGDLNVTSAEGAVVLYSRISAAANGICRPFDTDRYGQPDLIGLNKCIHRAVRNTVVKVARPALFAIYNSRNRDPLPITIASAAKR